MKNVYLSHLLCDSTPLYGGYGSVAIRPEKKIALGDSCNTHCLSFPNHAGTHIDFPYHFDDEGKKLTDYSPEFWIFTNPYVVYVYAQHDELIDLDDNNLQKIPEGTDFVIFKTGFQKNRPLDTYYKHNPGLNTGLAKRLRNRCPQIRAVGMDFISASSFQKREVGRLVHKEFLVENEILLIEDMDLSEISGPIKKLVCLPLRVEGLDGSPVTILAILEK